MLGVSVATILAVLDFIVAKVFLLLHTIFVALFRQFGCFGYGNGLQFILNRSHINSFLDLRNRGVQKDLEDEQDQFIKNKLNNHYNNHNDYINWQASPYK